MSVNNATSKSVNVYEYEVKEYRKMELTDAEWFALDFILRKNKVVAIKYIRSLKNLGLKESKDFCDWVDNKYPAIFKAREEFYQMERDAHEYRKAQTATNVMADGKRGVSLGALLREKLETRESIPAFESLDNAIEWFRQLTHAWVTDDYSTTETLEDYIYRNYNISLVYRNHLATLKNDSARIDSLFDTFKAN